MRDDAVSITRILIIQAKAPYYCTSSVLKKSKKLNHRCTSMYIHRERKSHLKLILNCSFLNPTTIESDNTYLPKSRSEKNEF